MNFQCGHAHFPLLPSEFAYVQLGLIWRIVQGGPMCCDEGTMTLL